jgi:hypothetical protein
VGGGDMDLLKGFDFNEENSLDQTLASHYVTALDRVSGDCSLTVPENRPADVIYSPYEATHYRYVFAVAEIDFVNGNFNLASKASAMLGLRVNNQPELLMELTMQPNGPNPMFLLVGIEFYQETNGNLLMLKSGAFNALQIVEVSKP